MPLQNYLRAFFDTLEDARCALASRARAVLADRVGTEAGKLAIAEQLGEQGEERVA